MEDKLVDLQNRLKRLRKAKDSTEVSEWIEKVWKSQNQIYISRSKPDEQDNIHWEKYKKAHFNDTYFKLEHIEEIGLPFDVAMVLSKRGTGKTYNYLRRCVKIASKGEQFVIVRNTKSEIEGGVTENIYELENQPFKIVNKNKIFWNTDEEQQEPVGYLAYLSGKTQQWQGAEYKKVTTIIWDEATNAGSTSEETNKWIRAFWQLTSTFFRNKTNGKVWIFGNLMKDHLRKISDRLHQYLAIDVDARFKYVITGQQIKYRLLYINLGELYTGADEHMMTSISASEEIKQELSSNLPSKMGECILPTHFFIKAEKKEWGILTQFDGKEWMILLASEPYIDLSIPENKKAYEKGEWITRERFYLIRCEPLHKGKIGFKMPLFTIDSNLQNMFKEIAILVKTKEKMARYWYRLYKIIKSGYACYIGDNSYFDITRIMNGRQQEIFSYKDQKRKKVQEVLSKGRKKQ